MLDYLETYEESTWKGDHCYICGEVTSRAIGALGVCTTCWKAGYRKVKSDELNNFSSDPTRKKGYRDSTRRQRAVFLDKVLRHAKLKGVEKAIKALVEAIKANSEGRLRDVVIEAENGLQYLHTQEMLDHFKEVKNKAMVAE